MSVAVRCPPALEPIMPMRFGSIAPISRVRTHESRMPDVGIEQAHGHVIAIGGQSVFENKCGDALRSEPLGKWLSFVRREVAVSAAGTHDECRAARLLRRGPIRRERRRVLLRIAQRLRRFARPKSQRFVWDGPPRWRNRQRRKEKQSERMTGRNHARMLSRFSRQVQCPNAGGRHDREYKPP